jgi:hypothetical protein
MEGQEGTTVSHLTLLIATFSEWIIVAESFEKFSIECRTLFVNCMHKMLHLQVMSFRLSSCFTFETTVRISLKLDIRGAGVYTESYPAYLILLHVG